MQVDWCSEEVVFKRLKDEDNTSLFVKVTRQAMLHKLLIWIMNLWLWQCWPGAAVQDAENQGKEMCGSTQSLHIYSQELQDPFQVSKDESKTLPQCTSKTLYNKCNISCLLIFTNFNRRICNNRLSHLKYLFTGLQLLANKSYIFDSWFKVFQLRNSSILQKDFSKNYAIFYSVKWPWVTLLY